MTVIRHCYNLIHYIGNSVIAPAFFQISSRKAGKLITGGLDKSGGLENCSKKVSVGDAYSGPRCRNSLLGGQ